MGQQRPAGPPLNTQQLALLAAHLQAQQQQRQAAGWPQGAAPQTGYAPPGYGHPLAGPPQQAPPGPGMTPQQQQLLLLLSALGQGGVNPGAAPGAHTPGHPAYPGANLSPPGSKPGQ